MCPIMHQWTQADRDGCVPGSLLVADSISRITAIMFQSLREIGFPHSWLFRVTRLQAGKSQVLESEGLGLHLSVSLCLLNLPHVSSLAKSVVICNSRSPISHWQERKECVSFWLISAACWHSSARPFLRSALSLRHLCYKADCHRRDLDGQQSSVKLTPSLGHQKITKNNK